MYVYIYRYISISIHRRDTGTQLQWRVTNMARNDLRARGGGAWGARSTTPTASINNNCFTCSRADRKGQGRIQDIFWGGGGLFFFGEGEGVL